jgi:hypothetical protein
MDLRIDVDLDGPIFRGEAPAVMARTEERVLDELADTGKNMVVGHLIQVIRQPTPYYWTQIAISDRATHDRLIHDSKVVYGPWLEGVSERNQTSRFKGYHTFRLMAQDLQNRAPAIADRVIADIAMPALDGA